MINRAAFGPWRPRLLDLYCKAGGAAVGYHRAGFEVVGVDIESQPNYPFRFYQGDALEVLDRILVDDPGWPCDEFAYFHASPPCQRWTAYGRRTGVRNDEKPDLIAATRERLQKLGRPYVIENIPGAPLIDPIRICGTSFPELDVQRHRMFESNVKLSGMPCVHSWRYPRYPGATNRMANSRRTVEIGVYRIPLPIQQRAMGIDWMTLPELSEAIPPAYTEHVGTSLLQLTSLRVAA